MKYKLSILIILVCTQFSFGQLTDDFSDGNFNLNPSWQGDSSRFIINSQNQLQLNSTSAGTSILSSNLTLNVNDTIEWDFYIEQSFAPSSQNYSRVYLISNQAILNGSLNGYYLQFGESGTSDAITLYKQNATTSISLGRGVNGRIASAFGVNVKVVYYPNGLFNIYTDFTGGNNFQLEFSANDNINSAQGFFGWECVYTISNATAFYLDNIYAGPYINDTIPPSVVEASFVNDSIFEVQFSESTTEFNLNNNVQLISTINSVDSFSCNSDSTRFEFKLHQQVNIGDAIQCKIFKVADLCFNLSDTITLNLTFIKCEFAHPGDLVINEIMCDPSGANSLPNAEYIEVFNNSNKFIETKNLFITDLTTTGALVDDTIEPHHYRVYSSSAGKLLLQSYGIDAISISNFPTLNNDGDVIQLKDSFQIIDEVNYNTSFYNDDFKNQGGWSMEKIQSDYLCTNTKNWKASCDARGGSPGLLNCNNDLLVDNERPEISSIYVIDSLHLAINFTEEINAANFTAHNFIIDDLFFADTFYVEKSFTNRIVVKSNLIFLPNEIHTLKFTNSIYDCNGNIMASNSIYNFGVGVSPLKGDLIFNEVLFNPTATCGDFIELYNTSEKIISLKNLSCTRRNLITNQLEYNGKISSSDLTIMPNGYCVLLNDEFDVLSCYPTIKKQFTINYSLPAMNDDEGKVVLLDANSTILDELYYSEKQHSQLLLDVEGVSLERISFSVATNNTDNWKSASCLSGCSTPSEKNSQAIDVKESSKFISINPAVISPDADGFDDNMQIEISNANAGMWGSLQITDYNGRVIRNIINADLIGTNEKMLWDGTDDKKQIVKSGIYILIAQLVNENGDVKNIRQPLIVAEGKR